MKRLAKNWRERLLKSYSSLSLLANILVALSISGLSVLGVINNVVALPVLVGLAITFGVVGLAGRIIDQGIDSLPDDVTKRLEEESKKEDEE